MSVQKSARGQAFSFKVNHIVLPDIFAIHYEIYIDNSCNLSDKFQNYTLVIASPLEKSQSHWYNLLIVPYSQHLSTHATNGTFFGHRHYKHSLF